MGQGSQVFTVLVVGDNPQELMDKYDINKEVDKYIKYKYLDAEKMKENSTKILEEIVQNPSKFNLNNFQIDALKDRLKSVKDMSTFEYYSSISQGLYYDDNGDAWSTENPQGKWSTAKIGDFFSMPFILKNGNGVHQAKAKDVDWDKMHMQNTSVYEIIWSMMKEGRKPTTEREQQLYDNMANKENYFNRFKNADEYVIHNCAYWNYAFLDENGWKDMDDFDGRDIEWIATYFDKFIDGIKDKDVQVTVFECTKRRD